MARYLQVKAVGGTMSIAVCDRCGKKCYAGDLRKDGNSPGLLVCSTECWDIKDPWRLPARKTERIASKNMRPDTNIGIIPTEWDSGNTLWDDGYTYWDGV